MRTSHCVVVGVLLVVLGVGVPRTGWAAGEPAGAPPPEVEMMGTWTGTITPAGAAEALDGGLIVIARDAAGLIATAGPNERALFPSKRLAPTEHGLRFEVTLDGVDTRLLVYDLAIADGAMTGTVTFVRHGLTQPAQLSFTRQ